jgi:hypothetical protein
MRNLSDPGWTLARGILMGALVTAVVMLSFPVVAAVGDSLLLGKSNSADVRTSLSGAADTNLRITNTKTSGVALELQVQSGSAPLKVNSSTRIPNLNGDLLDGKHASAFALAGHTHLGVYLPVTGIAANSSLLDGLDSTAFSLAGHAHGASDITSGALSEDRYSAYSDLGLEGYLDNNATSDLLTRTQADGRYVNEGALAYDSDHLDGLDASAFGRRNGTCAAGTLVGYDRTGAVCSGLMGSVAVDTGGNLGGFSSLVLDEVGRPVIAYTDYANGDLKVVHCGNPTCTSGNTIATVDASGQSGNGGTSVVLDAKGWPVVAYSDNAVNDLRVAHCQDEVCGTAEIRTVDSVGNVGSGPSLALDAAGYPVISYYEGAGGAGSLKLAHCTDNDCDGATITVVAPSWGSYTSLVLDASGNPVVAYSHDLKLKVVHCGDAACTAGNVIAEIGPGGCHGPGALVLDASGFPVVAFTSPGPEILRLAHCADEDCSTATVNTVDATGVTGIYASLVLDAWGNPVIAYRWHDAGDLKLARCGDEACGAGNTIVTVDAVGDTGYHASVVLDLSGNPLISYYQWSGSVGSLRLAGLTG